ncbi:MAG: hypothetical protein JW795_16745, partial [Chitinivibrionales bacterium]|nr:hypothetical protein [Chitinivibrionales bacterium]
MKNKSIGILTLASSVLVLQSCTDVKTVDATGRVPYSATASQFGYNPQPTANRAVSDRSNMMISQAGSSTVHKQQVDRSCRAATITATIEPAQCEATLQPGEDTAFHSRLHLPQGLVPAKSDIILAFDLTGSMDAELDSVKRNTIALIDSIQSRLPDVRFAVLSHMDYPDAYESCVDYYDAYGESSWGDYAYRLNQPLTSDIEAVVSAITTLTIGWGVDNPENYARIFYETYSDAAIAWRPDAKRMVLYWQDWVPHSCNFILDCNLMWEGNAGADPGRDGIMGTADDLDLATTLLGMHTHGISLVALHSGDYLPLWECYVQKSGGQAYQINPDGSLPAGNSSGNSIAQFVTTAAYTEALHLSRVELKVLTPGFESWVTSIDPMLWQNVDLADSIHMQFTLSLMVPIGTPNGVYTFVVGAIGDGTTYCTQTITITVANRVINLPPSTYPITVTNTTTPTPIIQWNYSDPESDPQVAYALQVWTGTNEGGTIVWEVLDGSGANQSITYAGQALTPNQTYYVSVQAYDGNEWGGWSQTSFTITYGIPTAEAGPDRTIPTGTDCKAAVTLDGTGSSDPNGLALQYTWTGPFGTVTGSTPTVSFTDTGHYTITLVVDNGYTTAADSVVMVVRDETP